MFCDRCGAALGTSPALCPQCGTPLPRLAAPGVFAGVAGRLDAGGPGAWMSAGWTAVTANFWTFVLLGLVEMVGAGTVPILLQGPLAMGLQWAALRQIRGRQAEMNDLSLGFEKFGTSVLICLVTSIFIGLAFTLLIVPGFIAVALLQFPMLLALDRGMDFWPAITESVSVSQKRLGSLLGLTLLQIGVAIGGALLCGVGLLVAVPWIYAASAAAYVDLFGLRPETEARMQ